MTSFLRVKTADVEFSVSGDALFVENAYDAVQNLILERFVDATNSPQTAASELTELSSVLSEPTEITLEEACHISFITCNEVYSKVHLVRCEELTHSIFGVSIDFSGVQRVYIDRELQPKIENYLTLGKVLWRELTTAGRAAIRNAT